VTSVVIVGASAAGVAVAEALARTDPSLEVHLVGDEPNIAHDRPPLSKQVLAGEWEPERAELLPPARREKLTATLHLGRRAIGVDEETREVLLDNRTRLHFDHLVVATGVRPRELPGGHPAGVHVIRTLADAGALRADLTPGGQLLVVGAGFLGLEVAATARKLGCSAVVVEPVAAPLASRLGRPAARRLLDLHAQHGVEVRAGVAVTRFETALDGRVTGASLSDGSTVTCTAALVAVGCVPNTEWLSGTSLDLTDGVRCDEFCAAAPGVWAVGDVARWRHADLGREIRIEHRLNATEQAIAVAGNITGVPAAFTPTPYFWTDHYDVKIQLAGVLDPVAEETVESLDNGGFVHTFRIDGRLVAVLGWNAAKAMMPLRRQLQLSTAAPTPA
jgi:NADPH-dependent 2,4-dienoyl-CoA reductase/sulfur reductase-like enzyme